MAPRSALIKAERLRNRLRAPLSSIPEQTREMFRCDRWACTLSRWSCALRWKRSTNSARVSAASPVASSGYERCRDCPVGKSNAALVPVSALTRKDGAK